MRVAIVLCCAVFVAVASGFPAEDPLKSTKTLDLHRPKKSTLEEKSTSALESTNARFMSQSASEQMPLFRNEDVHMEEELEKERSYYDSSALQVANVVGDHVSNVAMIPVSSAVLSPVSSHVANQAAIAATPMFSSQPAPSSAIGLFPNAKVGPCGIPLLLSCSPNVVQGQIAHGHSVAYPAPSSSYYRSSEPESMMEKSWLLEQQRAANPNQAMNHHHHLHTAHAGHQGAMSDFSTSNLHHGHHHMH